MKSPYFVAHTRVGFLMWVHHKKMGPPPKPWWSVMREGGRSNQTVHQFGSEEEARLFCDLLNRQHQIDSGYAEEEEANNVRHR